MRIRSKKKGQISSTVMITYKAGRPGTGLIGVPRRLQRRGGRPAVAGSRVGLKETRMKMKKLIIHPNNSRQESRKLGGDMREKGGFALTSRRTVKRRPTGTLSVEPSVGESKRMAILR